MFLWLLLKLMSQCQVGKERPMHGAVEAREGRLSQAFQVGLCLGPQPPSPSQIEPHSSLCPIQTFLQGVCFWACGQESWRHVVMVPGLYFNQEWQDMIIDPQNQEACHTM